MVVGSYFPESFGGTEIFTKDLSEDLIKRGLDVCVICAGENNSIDIVKDIQAYTLHIECNPKSKLKHKISNKCLEIYNKKMKKVYYKILKEEKPDILHVQMFRTITPSIDEVAKKLKIKVIHTLHEPYSAWNFNAFDFDNYDKLLDTKPDKLTKKYQNKIKKIVNKIDYIIAPSDCALVYYKDLGFYSNSNIKIKIIRNAINFSEEKVKEKIQNKLNNNRNGKINFLYLGRLFYYKGIENLISIFKTIKNNNIYLTIAGNGPLENYVKENIKNDDRIKYVGFVDGKLKEEILYNSDVQICPSEFLETFGLVILEGYANANVIIASDVGDYKNNVVHKKTGYLFSAKNNVQLKQAIEYFCDEKNICECLKNTLKKLKTFNRNKMINDYIEVYKEILNED